MISGLPGVVVVDDNQDELDTIKNALFGAGIPCLPVQYQNSEPENRSGIDHVNLSEWISPRIVITDLNLTEIQGAKPTNLVGPLAKMLIKMDLEGPYLLCVWSKLAEEVDEVRQLLEERYRDELTLPLRISVISKTEFSSAPEELRGKLERVISENALFKCLLSWESRVSKAAKNSMTALYSTAQESCMEKSSEAIGQALEKILATIGNESLGLKNAAANPEAAMDAGLLPVVEDQIRVMSGTGLDDEWKAAIPHIGEMQEIEDSVKSRLNAFFNIEVSSGDYPKDLRGVFVRANADYLDVPENAKKFEKRIGRTVKELLHEEFLPNNGDPAEKQFREEARKNTILGFLEVSPACDYAQRKVKFPRYVLGALIPERFESLTHPPSGRGRDGRAHEGIYRLPKINICGEVYILKFSFKYQFGAQPKDSQWFGETFFRLKEQILSAISFSCAQYSSRPGFISFF